MNTFRFNSKFNNDHKYVCDHNHISWVNQKFSISHYIYNETLHKSKVDLMDKNCFWNQCFDKSRLKNFVLWFLLNHGEHKTVQLVEQLKTLGFRHATQAGISLGVDDLKIPPKKSELIFEAEKLTLLTVNEYKRGEITGVERFQRLIDTWHRTSERLKQEVIDHFESTDILNPVYMMAFSGARGNISQVRQLVGMRGLMANPQGQIIDFPIRSNFREGLTLTEYIISSYGARKGIVDTALRTANAGYLTRRLVDVAQHVIISNFDCETLRGIFLTDMKEGNKTIYSLQNRLVGRVLARDIYSLIPDIRKTSTNSNQNELNSSKLSTDKESFSLIAKRNTEISVDLAFEIAKAHKKVFVRSSLTCETKKLVCQLCYGWSLAQGNLVSIGEAVGVVAAQSIGEPGTQLTMRTFHTGGVFSGDISDQIKAPFDGFVEYDQPIAGTLIRTPEGKIAFLTKNEGSFLVHKTLNPELENFSMMKDTSIKSKKYKIPAYTLVFKRMGEYAFEKEVIAQISGISRQKNSTDDAELTIKSDMEGQFYSKILDLQENKMGPKPKKEENEFFDSMNEQTTQSNSLASPTDGVMETFYEAWNWGYAWVLSGKIYQLSFPSSFFPKVGDFVNRNTIMNQLNWKFYCEGLGNVMKLHQSLTFLESKNTKGFRLNSLKNKNLIVSYFKNKKTNLKSLNTYKNVKYLTKGKNFLNSNCKHDRNTNNLNLLSSNKSLENVLNIPVITHSVLAFDIHTILYKKTGYFVKFKNSPFNFSKKNNNNSSAFVETFNSPSILSKNDILGVISSLEVPQNGISIFSNLSGKKNTSTSPNKELNALTNLSNSFSSSNWLPNSQYFLNWYPKHSQLLTPGLIALEDSIQNFPVLKFRKQKKHKTKLEKINPNSLVTSLSFTKERKYKLWLESILQYNLNQCMKLKNLDFYINKNNTYPAKSSLNIFQNSIQPLKNDSAAPQKTNIKPINLFKSNNTSLSFSNPFVSSVMKKEFVKKILKDEKNLKKPTKNLMISLSKYNIKQSSFDNSKSRLFDQSVKKKPAINYKRSGAEKLIFSEQSHAHVNLNKLYFALRWRNAYVYKTKPILDSKHTLKKDKVIFNTASLNLFATENISSRIFVVPQFFYQLNSTFSIFNTLSRKNIFFNSKNPIFYQINKQGYVKFCYISSSKSNFCLPNLAYSLNFKQFAEKQKHTMFLNSVLTIPAKIPFKFNINKNLFLHAFKEFCFEKNCAAPQNFNNFQYKTNLRNQVQRKQIYNVNQFKNFNPQLFSQKTNFKTVKLFKDFKKFKNNIYYIKPILPKLISSKSLTFNQDLSILNTNVNGAFINKKNELHKILKESSLNIGKKSFSIDLKTMKKKDYVNFSRLFSFSNSNCSTLKVFSKKLMYLTILKPNSTFNSQKNSSKSKLKNSVKSFTQLSIFNFCMLPFNALCLQSFYLTKSTLKIFDKVFFSKFINEKISKNILFNHKEFNTNLEHVITYKALCSNHDIVNISNNLLFKTKRLNLIKFLIFKSLYYFKNKHAFGTVYSKKARCNSLLKFMKFNKGTTKNHLNLESVNKKKSNALYLNKIPMQIKFGWVYLSPKLTNHFFMDKKFIFPGQHLCKEFVMDHHLSYVEFISLNFDPLSHQTVNPVNIEHKKNSEHKNFSYLFKNVIYCPAPPKKLMSNKNIVQEIKCSSIQKNLTTWNWVSNKKARYLPSFMQSSLKDIKQSFKNSLNVGLLIRKVNEHKQYPLQTYKREIYNFSSQQSNFVPKLNSILPKMSKKQMNSLNHSWYRYYGISAKHSYDKHSFRKFSNVLLNTKSLTRAAHAVNTSCLFKKQNIFSKKIIKKNQFIDVDKKIAKMHPSANVNRILKITKKFLEKKRIFVNKFCNSLTLQQEFRHSLHNKQQKNLQTLSKFPAIDFELAFNGVLYSVNQHSHFKSDLVTKINQQPDFSRNEKMTFPSMKINSQLSTTNQKLLTFSENSGKKLTHLFSTNNTPVMLPLISRKAINFSPFILSYKIPYGFDRIFNTDVSFFNYKHHLNFHVQKFSNSFYVTQFLDSYVQKLISYKKSQTFTPQKHIKKSDFHQSLQKNQVIFSEINSVIPVFFNCPYFSYNFIQKLDKTFIPNFNFLNLGENSSENNLEKLRLFSKKIEIKNQFFTSKHNKFRSSDCLGKTSSYSSFEGEMIYKKDLTLNHVTQFNSSNLFNSKHASEQSFDSFFPLSNPNSALILTKQDLIAFSFDKIKKHSFTHSSSTNEFMQANKKINPQIPSSKKQYYINDVIIKFQNMNSVTTETFSSSTSHETNLALKNNNLESIIKINKLSAGLPFQKNNVLLGEFFMYGDKLKNNLAIFETGQIIHISQKKVTLRRGQPIFVSPKAILHKYDGDFVEPKSSVITLAYSQLKTGDIIQGIPKVEQFFEARTTKRGRLFRDSLPNLLKGLFKRYASKYPLDKAVRQSFYKIQQIIVDGVQRVYRAQGAGIADKHLEIIVKQMTSKVRITQGAQTGFFAGEIVDLDLVEQVNLLLMKKIQYEPLVLGITKASLEVDSFLSAASFQQTTRVLSKAAMGRKKDFLKGLKENVILGNLIPAGTGYLVSLEK